MTLNVKFHQVGMNVRENQPIVILLGIQKEQGWYGLILFVLKKGSDLLNCEKEAVLAVVRENQYELEEAYRRVANGW